MQRPFFDALPLPSGKDQVGEAADKLLLFLRGLFMQCREEGYPVTHFFYEKPFIPGSVNSSTSERLMGLCCVVQMFAHQVKATSCLSIDISEWRKHFIGRGSGFKRAPGKKGKPGPYLPGHDPKELAIRECAKYGWHTDSADAADACGILDYALWMIDTGCRQAGLPGYPRPWRDNALLGGTM
jgi:hypothetical protein